MVTFPDSDRPLVEFADNSAGRKEASVVRGLVGAQAKALDRINNVIRLYEDADSRGLLESAGWDRSGEYASLDTELAFLRTDLALVKSGGLATTEGDDKWAGGLVPDSPAAWSSRRKALAELNAIRSTIENEARSQLSSKTRLDKATRERVIGASRPRSISRSDLAEREKGQALQDLVSPTTSTARKKVAVDQVEAGAREEAQGLGEEEDWLPLATGRLASALDDPALHQDKDAAKAATEKLSRYEEFALERAEKELASIQRAKVSGVTAGRDLTDEERAALERAQSNVTRARRAVLKQQVREMSPAKRRVWAAYPGMADVIAEVEAEQVFESDEGEEE